MNEFLITLENPARHHEYIISHSCRIDCGETKVSVSLVLIPDQSILKEGAFQNYLQKTFNFSNEILNPEEITFKIVDDVNNSLIPFWVRVKVTFRKHSAGYKTMHFAVLEDRQPGWENSELLANIEG